MSIVNQQSKIENEASVQPFFSGVTGLVGSAFFSGILNFASSITGLISTFSMVNFCFSGRPLAPISIEWGHHHAAFFFVVAQGGLGLYFRAAHHTLAGLLNDQKGIRVQEDGLDVSILEGHLELMG